MKIALILKNAMILKNTYTIWKYTLKKPESKYITILNKADISPGILQVIYLSFLIFKNSAITLMPLNLRIGKSFQNRPVKLGYLF